MGYILIRPHPDADEYVIWCTISDMPVGYGSREETREDVLSLDPGRLDIDAALDVTDLQGSSTVNGFGWYGQGEFVYNGRGMLAREDLVMVAVLHCQDCADEVVAYLRPFPDDH